MNTLRTKNKFTKAGLMCASAIGVLLITGTIVSAAADSTTINAEIQPVISVSSGPTVAISITPTSAGAITSAKDTVTVSTNDSAGYDLTLKDSDTDNSLNGTPSGTIAASSGSRTTPATLSSNNIWGYRVDGIGGFGTGGTVLTNVASSTLTWAAVPKSSGTADNIKTTSAPASGDTTTVWYAVRADTTIHSGTYSDTVTYTATTK